MGEYDITTGYLFRQFPDDFVKFTAGDTARKVKLADPVLKQISTYEFGFILFTPLQNNTLFNAA